MLAAAGTGLAGALAAPAALARPGRDAPAPHAGANPSLGGSYSQRAYSVPSSPGGIAEIGRAPADLPPPLTRRPAQTVEVALQTIELDGDLDSATNTKFRYWTFGGRVPGPMIRARVGDTVEVALTNDAESMMLHNIDCHAVTGPGGGAEASTAAPGETKRFRFKALKPGLFVYHCAVPPVALHIAQGMYGLMLIEPEEGLPPVDREFYVMQGEIYSEQPFATAGFLDASYEKLLDERPEYFVFNGSVGALTTRHPMSAKVGETVRFFFGVGGPAHTSSLLLIGEIFDRVYPLGALPAAPLANVGTVSVPAGGAVIAEVTFDVPGRYVLVDHSLARTGRGLAAWIDVEGPENPAVFAAISPAPEPG